MLLGGRAVAYRLCTWRHGRRDGDKVRQWTDSLSSWAPSVAARVTRSWCWTLSHVFVVSCRRNEVSFLSFFPLFRGLLRKCLKSLELVLLCMVETSFLTANCSWLTIGPFTTLCSYCHYFKQQFTLIPFIWAAITLAEVIYAVPSSSFPNGLGNWNLLASLCFSLIQRTIARRISEYKFTM